MPRRDGPACDVAMTGREAKCPEISVCIVSHNRRENLVHLLEKLLPMATVMGYEVVVVDDLSDDGSAELLREQLTMYPTALRVMLRESNDGVTVGRNAVTEMAVGRYIVCLDDDSIIDPAMLSSIPRWFNRLPQAGILAFRIRHARSGEWQNDLGSSVTPFVSTYHGAGYALRRDALLKVGCYDVECRFGAEEIDMSIRMRDAGFEVVYVPDLIVDHDSLPRSGREGLWRRREWAFGFSRVLFKHFEYRLASLWTARLCLSWMVSAWQAGGPHWSFLVIVSALRGSFSGQRAYQGVRLQTMRFYDNSDLRPEYGNVPVLRKLAAHRSRKNNGKNPPI